MKKRPDITSVQDIVRAAKLAQTFLKGISQESFSKDLKTQAAICRQLEIIGEATTRLSADFKKSVSAVPWREMVGMRNILIHLYEDVDTDQLWRTVDRDLPVLISALEPHSAKD